jgi:hypothetical protein
MEVDNVQPSSLGRKQQPQADHPDVDDLAKANLKQAAQQSETAGDIEYEHTGMQSKDLVNEKPASSKEASTPISTSELDALYARLETAKQELAQARQKEKQHAAVVRDLKAMEHERDRYRAVSNVVSCCICQARKCADSGLTWWRNLCCIDCSKSCIPEQSA